MVLSKDATSLFLLETTKVINPCRISAKACDTESIVSLHDTLDTRESAAKVDINLENSRQTIVTALMLVEAFCWRTVPCY